MIGRTVSHYRITGRLGAGGMGVVYRAEDTRLGRPVALKFLPPEKADSGAAAERLQREARAASSLNHPNICTIYDIGEFEGQHFMAMELVEGETLAERLAAGPMTIEQVVALGVEIAGALDTAHTRGIIHRDLKPANVVITRAGHAKVLDFGLAKQADAGSDATIGEPLSAPGVALGTVAYMSPEQARGEPVDARSDIFSFGLVLHEMLTGQPVYGGTTSAVIFDGLLNREAPPLRTRVPAVPPRIDALVGRMLAKRPALRPQAASEVGDELRAVQRALHSSSDARRAPSTTPTLAIMPFRDLSPERDQAYFCEGIADEIVAALSAKGGIHVASRTSAARAQEKGLDIAEIGQRLNVQHVVEGSVRKAGNRVRITAQLTSVADGYQLWTERYDRDMDDVFAVQDDIARTISERLRVKLAPEVDAPLIKKATDSMEAYALCLKGRYHWARRNRWHLRAAIECYEKAVAIDPDYALAQAGIADCYTVMQIYAVRPGDELAPLATRAAQRALTLDPTLPEAHHAVGAVRQWIEHDFDGAEAEYARAIELKSTLAISHAYMALSAAVRGHRDRAREQGKRALALEPDSPVINYICGGMMYWIGDLDLADRWTRQALDLEPEAAFAHWVSSLLLWRRGQLDDAARASERALTLGERQPTLMGIAGFTFARAGRERDAEHLVAEAEARAGHEYFAPIWLAQIHVGLRRYDEALTCLERAYVDRNGWIQTIAAEPMYDEMRDHPRFKALVRQMNLA